MIYEFPSTTIFPDTSRSDDITILPLDRPINESSKNLFAPTIGILLAVNPAIEILEPNSAFAVVTRPVVAFENCITFVVVFPRSVIPCNVRVPPPVDDSRAVIRLSFEERSVVRLVMRTACTPFAV